MGFASVADVNEAFTDEAARADISAVLAAIFRKAATFTRMQSIMSATVLSF